MTRMLIEYIVVYILAVIGIALLENFLHVPNSSVILASIFASAGYVGQSYVKRHKKMPNKGLRFKLAIYTALIQLFVFAVSIPVYIYAPGDDPEMQMVANALGMPWLLITALSTATVLHVLMVFFSVYLGGRYEMNKQDIAAAKAKAKG